MDKRIVAAVAVVCLTLVGAGVWLAGRQGRQRPVESVASGKAVKMDLEVSEKDWQKGTLEAAVTVVEYADFQCPACAEYHKVLKQLATETQGKAKFVFRHYPLNSIHDKAWAAAKAAEAAGKQGKFWEMHDKLFETQSQWARKKPAEAMQQFEDMAKEIGLDPKRWKADFDSDEVDKKVRQDLESGNRFGVNGTPTFFVNGVMIKLPGSKEKFKKILEEAEQVGK